MSPGLGRGDRDSRPWSGCPCLGSSERYVSIIQSVLGAAGEGGGDRPVTRHSRWRLTTEGSSQSPKVLRSRGPSPVQRAGVAVLTKSSSLKLRLQGPGEVSYK